MKFRCLALVLFSTLVGVLLAEEGNATAKQAAKDDDFQRYVAILRDRKSFAQNRNAAADAIIQLGRLKAVQAIPVLAATF